MQRSFVIGDLIRGSLDAFYYLTWIFGITLIITYAYYWINKNNFDEEKRLKIVRFKNLILKATVISIIINIISIFTLLINLDILSNTIVSDGYIQFLGLIMYNKAEAICCISCFVLYIIIFIILGNYIINKNQYDEDKKLKKKKRRWLGVCLFLSLLYQFFCRKLSF